MKRTGNRIRTEGHVIAVAVAAVVGSASALGAGPDSGTPQTPLGDDRHMCARYDGERAIYTGTMALLEPADDSATGRSGGAAHRLVVLAMHEDTPPDPSHASGEPVLTPDQAAVLLGDAQAAHLEGRATREEYSGHAVREGNRLRFTSAGGHAMPRTMIVFTTAGLAIMESTAGRRSGRIDGSYRCARPQPPASRPQIPTLCAQGRSGSVDLDTFAAPRAEVTLIQTALDRAGMTPGPIDGILGPRTLGALIRWNERTSRQPGRLVAYEIICPLIEAHGAEQAR